ncbi:MAG: amidohydrolase family protein [Pseudomonadota bacterium]
MTFACLAPFAKVTPPRVKPPAEATDCHAHVIGVPPHYPFIPERAYTPPEATVEAYQALHRDLGLERAVIVTPSVHGTDNRITLEAIAAYGPGARGVAVVEEGIRERELHRLHDGGIRGLRLNVLFGGGVGLHAFEGLSDKIRDLGWHLQLWLDVSLHLEAMSSLIRQTNVPIVIDHMGFIPVEKGIDDPGFQLLLELVRDGICWVKLSGNYRIAQDHPRYASAIPMAQALIEAGPDRMVWGTDWPHVALKKNMVDDGDLLNALDDYAPSADLKRAILVDNPARLYDFV